MGKVKLDSKLKKAGKRHKLELQKLDSKAGWKKYLEKLQGAELVATRNALDNGNRTSLKSPADMTDQILAAMPACAAEDQGDNATKQDIVDYNEDDDNDLEVEDAYGGMCLVAIPSGGKLCGGHQWSIICLHQHRCSPCDDNVGLLQLPQYFARWGVDVTRVRFRFPSAPLRSIPADFDWCKCCECKGQIYEALGPRSQRFLAWWLFKSNHVCKHDIVVETHVEEQRRRIESIIQEEIVEVGSSTQVAIVGQSCGAQLAADIALCSTLELGAFVMSRGRPLQQSLAGKRRAYTNAKTPKMVNIGHADDVFDPEASQRFYKEAFGDLSASPNVLYKMPLTGHSDGNLAAKQEFSEIARFLVESMQMASS